MTEQVPTASYEFKAVHCKDAKELTKLLDKERHEIGFYIYGLVPDGQGGITAVLARADQKAMAIKKKPHIEAGLTPLSEEDAKLLLKRCEYVRPEHASVVDNFIVWLYENSYRILHEVKP